MRGAVIFDRDGVLNQDVGFAFRPDQIIWIPGAAKAVRMVNQAGLFAFVATNQSGVARGYYTEEDIALLHQWMNAELAKEGAHIDAFYHSPFHPDGSVDAYRRVSDCRKPGGGMIRKILSEWPVDPARALMVGDKESDLAAAAAAGILGSLFEGGDLSAFLGPLLPNLTKLGRGS